MGRLGRTVIALVAASAAASSAMARQQPLQEQQQQHVVRYRSLDLGSAAGARSMYRRIDGAALRICGGGRGSVEALNRALRRSDCWYGATSEAVGRLAAPRVTAAWQAAVGRRAVARGRQAAPPAASRP